jgi:hypothetical protein
VAGRTKFKTFHLMDAQEEVLIVTKDRITEEIDPSVFATRPQMRKAIDALISAPRRGWRYSVLLYKYGFSHKECHLCWFNGRFAMGCHTFTRSQYRKLKAWAFEDRRES